MVSLLVGLEDFKDGLVDHGNGTLEGEFVAFRGAGILEKCAEMCVETRRFGCGKPDRSRCVLIDLCVSYAMLTSGCLTREFI
jgi:hypothetical protein